MSSGGLTILAVDDERSQLEDLARLLRASSLVAGVECASDGHQALVKASTRSFDAIFLDVRMPDLDGLELGRVLTRFATAPQLVFVSAYDSAAVDAFELHALDYLRKPVARSRVQEAVERVAAAVERVAAAVERVPAASASEPRQAPPMAERNGGETEMVAVAGQHGGAIRLLARSTILYVQSYGDYVRIVTPDGRFLMRCTLSEIERRWAAHGFFRVHRQYVANLRNAVELRPLLSGTAELSFPDGRMIPVARRHAAELGRRLNV